MSADEAVRQAMANSRLEGLEVPPEALPLLYAVARGEVSGDDAVAQVSADYIGPTATWWRIAYADRPGRFSYDRAEAIRIAEETGAQFVQERGGDRRIVWEAV